MFITLQKPLEWTPHACVPGVACGDGAVRSDGVVHRFQCADGVMLVGDRQERCGHGKDVRVLQGHPMDGNSGTTMPPTSSLTDHSIKMHSLHHQSISSQDKVYGWLSADSEKFWTAESMEPRMSLYKWTPNVSYLLLKAAAYQTRRPRGQTTLNPVQDEGYLERIFWYMRFGMLYHDRWAGYSCPTSADISWKLNALHKQFGDSRYAFTLAELTIAELLPCKGLGGGFEPHTW